MNLVLTVIAVIWAAGIPVAWKRYTSMWNNGTAEKAVGAILWPLTASLYVIHYYHNKK